MVSYAFPKAFTTSNITAGFKATGIWPFDRHIFPQEAFLPSRTTDRPLLDEDNDQQGSNGADSCGQAADDAEPLVQSCSSSESPPNGSQHIATPVSTATSQSRSGHVHSHAPLKKFDHLPFA